MSADIARLTRERDEAREACRDEAWKARRAEERAASLSRELLTAIQARDSYRASAELRVGMRREFEALLGCGDTMGDVAFAAGLARLRELVAAERRAADEKRQRTEAITRICGAFGITSALQLAAIAERDDETTLDLVVKLINREHAAKKAAESRAARLAEALENIEEETTDAFAAGIARAALAAEEGK